MEFGKAPSHLGIVMLAALNCGPGMGEESEREKGAGCVSVITLTAFDRISLSRF